MGSVGGRGLMDVQEGFKRGREGIVNGGRKRDKGVNR